MTLRYFISIDGDLIGRRLEHFILSSDIQNLTNFGNQVNEAIQEICYTARELGGVVYLHGGDSLLLGLNDYSIFLTKYEERAGKYPFTFSVGIGENTIAAYMALKIAKSHGMGLTIYAKRSEDTFSYIQLDS